MRMWCIPPVEMCDKHLLGEHVELHMFVGSIRRDKKLFGYIDKGLLDSRKIADRHAQLAKEMKRRGFRHQSALPAFDAQSWPGVVNPEVSRRELKKRCPSCRKLIK